MTRRRSLAAALVLLAVSLSMAGDMARALVAAICAACVMIKE